MRDASTVDTTDMVGPVVDVGLTAYRRATYIGEAIESVLGQTHEDWRLTVCDNGTGQSAVRSVVESYLDDPRIRYVSANDDLSLASNWTSALNQGNGPYVAVLNDDDRWHPAFLRNRVDALEAHPACGFAFSEWTVIDERGAEVLKAPIRFEEGVMSRERLAALLVRQNLVVPPAILLRRSACIAVGAYFDEHWQYCDWEFWARLASRFPAYYLARHDNDYRRHTMAYTFETRESPNQLLAMVEHLERSFTTNVDGFRLGKLERARVRSRILVHAAGDVHGAGGWRASGATYRRAIAEYPPTLASRTSMAMIGKSLLGARGTRRLRSLLGTLRQN